MNLKTRNHFRHHLEPRSEEEAKQFQAENLLLASRSGQVSRAISRVGSRIMSRRSSVQSSAQISRSEKFQKRIVAAIKSLCSSVNYYL